MKLLYIAILLFISCACDKKYDAQICEDLSMQSFKGSPRAETEYQKHCQNFPNRYPKATCQKALEALIMGKSKDQLQEAFGPSVLGCFTENDVYKFLKDKSK